jgi:nitrogen fixation NifU-like protein
LSDPYADGLLEEARQPLRAGSLPSPRRRARAANPVCGDEIELDVDDDGARIVDLAHRTRGCVFTRASASLLARSVLGLDIRQARALSETLRRDLGGSAQLPPDLAALASVRIYPARIRCALLPWEALRSALDAMA